MTLFWSGSLSIWILPPASVGTVLGQAGRVETGSHTIECGTSIPVDIPKELLSKFDYQSP
jgi:hypothetical protein